MAGFALQNHFRVGVHHYNPQYFWTGESEEAGTAYEFMKSLSKLYNFTFSITLIPHTLSTLEDGSLSGWENEVASGRIDADVFYSANYITHRPDLEASTFIWSNSVIFIAKHPEYTTKWTTIMHSLQPTTWAMFAVVTILFAITTSLKLHCPTTSASITRNLSFAVAMVYKSLVGQSIVQKIPDRIRNLLSIWLLSSMIITMYFSSNLLSLLTFPVPSSDVPRDMVSLSKSGYKIYVMDMPGGPIEDSFNKTTNPDMANIWKRATLTPVMNCMMKSITMAETACIGFDIFLDPLLQANATINEQFYPAVRSQNSALDAIMSNVVVRRNSAYADAFNDAVGWVRDTGLYLGWMHKIDRITTSMGRAWLTSPAQRESNLYKELEATQALGFGRTLEPLRINYLLASFLALGSGSFLALVIYATETVFKRATQPLFT